MNFVLGQKPSRRSVPAGLTLASDLAFVFNENRVRLECCIDPLRPPDLPSTNGIAFIRCLTCCKIRAVIAEHPTFEIYSARETILAHASTPRCSSQDSTCFSVAFGVYHPAHYICSRIVDGYLACASWKFDDLQNQEDSHSYEMDGKVRAAGSAH